MKKEEELERVQEMDRALDDGAKCVERSREQLLEVFQRIINKKPTSKDFLVIGKLLYYGHLHKIFGYLK